MMLLCDTSAFSLERQKLSNGINQDISTKFLKENKLIPTNLTSLYFATIEMSPNVDVTLGHNRLILYAVYSGL